MEEVAAVASDYSSARSLEELQTGMAADAVDRLFVALGQEPQACEAAESLEWNVEEAMARLKQAVDRQFLVEPFVACVSYY